MDAGKARFFLYGLVIWRGKRNSQIRICNQLLVFWAACPKIFISAHRKLQKRELLFLAPSISIYVS